MPRARPLTSLLRFKFGELAMSAMDTYTTSKSPYNTPYIACVMPYKQARLNQLLSDLVFTIERHPCMPWLQIATRQNSRGCIYSLDWTTGLDYWTGLLDSPLTQKIMHTRISLAPRLCQFVYYSADGLSGKLVPPILLVMV